MPPDHCALALAYCLLAQCHSVPVCQWHGDGQCASGRPRWSRQGTYLKGLTVCVCVRRARGSTVRPGFIRGSCDRVRGMKYGIISPQPRPSPHPSGSAIWRRHGARDPHREEFPDCCTNTGKGRTADAQTGTAATTERPERSSEHDGAPRWNTLHSDRVTESTHDQLTTLDGYRSWTGSIIPNAYTTLGQQRGDTRRTLSRSNQVDHIVQRPYAGASCIVARLAVARRPVARLPSGLLLSSLVGLFVRLRVCHVRLVRLWEARPTFALVCCE